MALVNRDKDVSEQKLSYHSKFNTSVAASAGSNFHAFVAPYPCTLKAIELAAETVSGAPSVAFAISRFVVGAGATTYGVTGATTAVLAFSTSGAVAVSMAAAGSSLLTLSTGDVLVCQQLFGAGNLGLGGLTCAVVVQALQDIREHFGSTT